MAIRNYIFGFFIILCSCQTILSQTATVCAGVPTGSFVRNSNSCRAYYYCADNGVAHPSQCPENYLFEPVRQICQIASYVQCTGCSPFGVHHIAHPTDCTSYYMCVSGIRTLRKCGENLIFDKSIGDCNTASSVQCIRDYTQICGEFGGYVKIGDPNDCSKYFTCYYGEAYHQSCAPGLYFKPAIASCTFPEEYNYCQGDGPIVLPSDVLSIDGNKNYSNESYIILPGENNIEMPSENNNEEPIEEHSDNNSEGPSDNNSEEPSDNNSEETSDNNIEEPNDIEEDTDEPSDSIEEHGEHSDNGEEPTDNNNDEPSFYHDNDNNSEEPRDSNSQEFGDNEEVSEYNEDTPYMDYIREPPTPSPL